MQVIGRRMQRIELAGKIKRGRPKRGFMNVVREDMQEVSVAEEAAAERMNWGVMIRCGDF